MRKMTEEELERARSFIQQRRWKFASTYAKIAPHDYSIRFWVRGDAEEAEFEWFAGLTLECGYRQNYYKRINRYLEVDGHKYWIMDPTASGVETINRATLTAFQPPGSTSGRFKEDYV